MTGLPNEASRSCPVVKHTFNPSFREKKEVYLSSFRNLIRAYLRTYVDLSFRWRFSFYLLSKSRRILHAPRLPRVFLIFDIIIERSGGKKREGGERNFFIRLSIRRSRNREGFSALEEMPNGLFSPATRAILRYIADARPTTLFSVRFARSAKFKAVGASRA